MGSKEILIEAARQCLIEHGHEACSIKLIAKIAGVNHGLVHHYFDSKEQLMIAVLNQSTDHSPAGHGPEPSPEEYRKILNEHLFKDPRTPRLMFEMISMSRLMPELETELSRVFERALNRFITVLGLEDRDTAIAVMSALIGLSMYSHLDRRVNFPKIMNKLLSKLGPSPNTMGRKIRKKKR